MSRNAQSCRFSLGASGLINQSLWWSGPDFIATAEVKPPAVPKIDITSIAQAELSKSQPAITHTLAALEVRNVRGLEQLTDPNAHSSLDSLLHVLAYVLRFVDAMKKCKGVDCHGMTVTSYEITRPEIFWIQAVQQGSFEREIQFLLKPTGACPQLVNQFGFFIDDDQLLRCQGRLQLTLSSKNPVLLPSRHPFVNVKLMRWQNTVE